MDAIMVVADFLGFDAVKADAAENLIAGGAGEAGDAFVFRVFEETADQSDWRLFFEESES